MFYSSFLSFSESRFSPFFPLSINRESGEKRDGGKTPSLSAFPLLREKRRKNGKNEMRLLA